MDYGQKCVKSNFKLPQFLDKAPHFNLSLKMLTNVCKICAELGLISGFMFTPCKTCNILWIQCKL